MVEKRNRFFMNKTTEGGVHFVIEANVNGLQVKLFAYPEVDRDGSVYYQGPVVLQENSNEDTD